MTLSLDTDIPYFNATDVLIEDQDEDTKVSFTADPKGAVPCLWFCLRLVNQDESFCEGRTFDLVLKHFENMHAASLPPILQPAVRFDNGDWIRLPTGISQTLPDGRIVVKWRVDYPATTIDIALCYPYGEAELNELLENTGQYWGLDAIGVSSRGRSVLRLSNSGGGAKDKRQGIYLIAREHGGETPGSWVLDGILRGLASARRDDILVWSVPLADMDGVAEGRYGRQPLPCYLDRAWDAPPLRHEALVIQNDIRRWASRCEPLLVMELFASPPKVTEGLWFATPDHPKDEVLASRCARAVSVMREALGEDLRSPNVKPHNQGYGRWLSSRLVNFCTSGLGVCSLGVEIPYSQCNGKELTQDLYQEAGRRIARCLLSDIAG